MYTHTHSRTAHAPDESDQIRHCMLPIAGNVYVHFEFADLHLYHWKMRLLKSKQNSQIATDLKTLMELGDRLGVCVCVCVRASKFNINVISKFNAWKIYPT